MHHVVADDALVLETDHHRALGLNQLAGQALLT
jgi:hypothetical protein